MCLEAPSNSVWRVQLGPRLREVKGVDTEDTSNEVDISHATPNRVKKSDNDDLTTVSDHVPITARVNPTSHDPTSHGLTSPGSAGTTSAGTDLTGSALSHPGR